MAAQIYSPDFRSWSSEPKIFNCLEIHSNAAEHPLIGVVSQGWCATASKVQNTHPHPQRVSPRAASVPTRQGFCNTASPRAPYNDLHAQALQVPGRVRVARARPAQSLVLGWGSPTKSYILLYTLNRVDLPHPKKKRRARARAGPLACVGVSFRPQRGSHI